MKTGYLSSDNPYILLDNKYIGSIYQAIGWIAAANFFIIIKAWGMEDTTGYLIFSKTRNLLAVHIEATFMGLSLGLILAYLDNIRVHFFGRKKGFGMVILIKAISYLITIIITITLVAFFFLLLLGADIHEALSRISLFITSTYFLSIVIYGAAVSFLFSFIKQVDSKFGPGNLYNMLIGKYHHPRIEDRIFLFMDLKNATRYAELLGHLQYSQLIQDCFYDVHSIIRRFQGEIYQYVGDEIVITWKSSDGLKNDSCIRLFFEYKNKLQQRSDHYEARYGFVPDFKAGMNCGHITVAEVGISKREIAYHGDVINTASRIQHQCNSYEKQLLISRQMKRRLGNKVRYQMTYLDSIILKGKNKPVELYSVEE